MDDLLIKGNALEGEQTTAASLDCLEGAEPVRDGLPDWLEGMRRRAGSSGDHLVYEIDEEEKVIPLVGDAIHIGRSLSAHVRLDDASVSRRHAILAHRDGTWHLLDDRSLNGISLNGEVVSESAALKDGDEIIIGRLRLYLLLAR
jgi:hypothetical protein